MSATRAERKAEYQIKAAMITPIVRSLTLRQQYDLAIEEKRLAIAAAKEVAKIEAQRERQRLAAERRANQLPKKRKKTFNPNKIKTRATLERIIKEFPVKRPFYRTEADERLVRNISRAREVVKRTETLKYWRKKNPAHAAKLKAIWAERDAEQGKLRAKLLIDYICTLCNRPFATVRVYRKNQQPRCPSCQRFVRLSDLRKTYRKHDTQRLEYAQQQYQRSKTQKIPEQVTKVVPPPVPQPYTGSGPAVVWTAHDD